MSDKTLPEADLSLCARIEALLFVAVGAVTPAQLSTALGLTVNEVERGLELLTNRYLEAAGDFGLRVQFSKGRVQLTTAPRAAADVDRFLGLDANTRLSRAALETLAIIAYQQPITRPQIDAIRGVNSDGVLKSLLSKGLIQDVGRAEAPGRPILFSTTPEFLQYFGLNRLEDLPPLDVENSPNSGPGNGPVLLKE